MNNNLEFKIATIDDVEDIISLCNECFEEKTDLENARKIFLENEADKNQIYLNGIIDGKIVAHTKITIVPTIYGKMGTYAIVNHVCVKPEYRRHGIGTKLLDEASKICKERNVKTIELWSKNFRTAAHACYNKYGFTAEDAKYFTKEI